MLALAGFAMWAALGRAPFGPSLRGVKGTRTRVDVALGSQREGRST